MQKIRITIIYPTDPLGPKAGGIETFMRGFIKYVPEGLDVEFIGITSDCKERPPKIWQHLNLGGREFDFLPLFFEKNENKKTIVPLSLRFTFALKFTNLKTEKRIFFFNRAEPAILFRKSSVPKIAVIHADIQKEISQGGNEALLIRFPRIYFAFESSVFKSFNRIYTVSRNTFEFYRLKYPKQKEKFAFLRTWADTDVFHSTDEAKSITREKLCLSENRLLPIKNKWILFVGRLQKVKAPMRLLDTFCEYRKKDKTACLIIIGTGNLRKKMEQYGEKIKIKNNVFFFDSMNQKVLNEFYNASDALLLTSNSEGMPMCVLEALRCGLPVVSTDVGEIKRVVKNNVSGEVSKSFSPRIISQSLEKVLGNPGAYSGGACIKAVSEYTPEKALKPLYEIMERLYEKN